MSFCCSNIMWQPKLRRIFQKPSTFRPLLSSLRLPLNRILLARNIEAYLLSQVLYNKNIKQVISKWWFIVLPRDQSVYINLQTIIVKPNVIEDLYSVQMFRVIIFTIFICLSLFIYFKNRVLFHWIWYILYI